MEEHAIVPPPDEASVLDRFLANRHRLQTELEKAIVGQKESVEQILIGLIAGGHSLITGAPGLAKTLLVKSIAQVFSLHFQRIQFTPDLMPADITGTEILTETETGRRLKFMPGPVFGNLILADEINRTPPKTQAALLEAMQERQVTAAGVRYPLPAPFFVLATQNPIEMEGTYPLPEAQLDRFMFNVVMDYLPEEEELSVVTRTTGVAGPAPGAVMSGEDLQAIHQLARRVPMAEDVARYAVRLVAATRPGRPEALAQVNDYLSWGAGLRASQFLVLGAKARALWQGRTHATVQDIQKLAYPVLRHRLLTNYRAEAEGMTTERIIGQLLEAVKPAR